jgi:hypothetical protein
MAVLRGAPLVSIVIPFFGRTSAQAELLEETLLTLDFYLRVARASSAWCFQHPPITRYRRYSTSSSRDGVRMLESVRVVYDRQRPFVADDPCAVTAFDRGLQRLTDIFLDCMVENVHDRVRRCDDDGAIVSARVLRSEDPGRWQRLIATGDSAIVRLAAQVER